jgi:hypothetical protein
MRAKNIVPSLHLSVKNTKATLGEEDGLCCFLVPSVKGQVVG